MPGFKLGSSDPEGPDLPMSLVTLSILKCVFCNHCEKLIRKTHSKGVVILKIKKIHALGKIGYLIEFIEDSEKNYFLSISSLIWPSNQMRATIDLKVFLPSNDAQYSILPCSKNKKFVMT